METNTTQPAVADAVGASSRRCVGVRMTAGLHGLRATWTRGTRSSHLIGHRDRGGAGERDAETNHYLHTSASLPVVEDGVGNPARQWMHRRCASACSFVWVPLAAGMNRGGLVTSKREPLTWPADKIWHAPGRDASIHLPFANDIVSGNGGGDN